MSAGPCSRVEPCSTQLPLAASHGQTHTCVLPSTPQPTSPTSKVLRKGDVLLAFDGVPIANGERGDTSCDLQPTAACSMLAAPATAVTRHIAHSQQAL